MGMGCTGYGIAEAGEPGTVQGNETLDDCTLYLIIGHL